MWRTNNTTFISPSLLPLFAYFFDFPYWRRIQYATDSDPQSGERKLRHLAFPLSVSCLTQISGNFRGLIMQKAGYALKRERKASFAAYERPKIFIYSRKGTPRGSGNFCHVEVAHYVRVAFLKFREPLNFSQQPARCRDILPRDINSFFFCFFFFFFFFISSNVRSMGRRRNSSTDSFREWSLKQSRLRRVKSFFPPIVFFFFFFNKTSKLILLILNWT